MADSVSSRNNNQAPPAGAEQQRRYTSWLEEEPAFEVERLAATHPRPRPAARRRRRSFPRWLIAPAVVVGLVLILFVAALYFDGRSRGVILENIHVAGVDVSGLTPEDAEAALRLRYESFQIYPVTLVYDDRVWRPQGSEIGLQVDWTYAISEAMAIGHTGSLLERWWQRYATWSGRRDILLPLRQDDGRLQTYLEGLSFDIDVPPLDAALVIDGQQVTTRPGRVGRSLEVVPSMRTVKDALVALSTAPITLTVHTVPPTIDDDAIRTARETAQKMLTGPITLHLDGRTWPITVEEIGQMLKIEHRQDERGESIAVVLDQDRLRKLLESIAEEVRVYPRNAHFRFVEDHLEITDEGANGVELQVDRGISQVNEAVLSDRRDVTLAVQVVQPKINRDTVDELGIRGVVGMGQSYFGGSAAYRQHNIVIAARILDGTLIPPGETFSFIAAAGSIDESDGFVAGYSIIGGRTVLSIGGGVCQVSTTVFRAAFWAGLPITERHAHNFRISWYTVDAPLGMDATIFTETGTDFKFVNNTSGYLLLQFEVYSDTGDLYAYLYGTPSKYEVVLDGPYLANWTPAPTDPVYVDNPTLPAGYLHQTDYAQGGVDSTIYRKLMLDGKEVATDTFFSHYQAWPNIFERGTGAP
jgi:vancomycin resistance protein YoaR